MLWCMERRNFRKIIDHINSINFNENIQFINGIGLFTNLQKNLKTILARNLIKVYYEAKQVIVKEGDQLLNFGLDPPYKSKLSIHHIKRRALTLNYRKSTINGLRNFNNINK